MISPNTKVRWLLVNKHKAFPHPPIMKTDDNTGDTFTNVE